jgi:anti-anti-sigma factor
VTTSGRDTEFVELDEGRDPAAVVHVHADVDASIATCLRRTLADAIDRHAHVIVDLSGASTLDPAGLGVLVRAQRRARRRGGTVCFAGPSRYVVTVLHTMRLDAVFPLFDDCPSALEWLRREAAGAAMPATRS